MHVRDTCNGLTNVMGKVHRNSNDMDNRVSGQLKCNRDKCEVVPGQRRRIQGKTLADIADRRSVLREQVPNLA